MLEYISPISFLDLSQTLYESNRISVCRSVCNKGSLLPLARYSSPLQCSFRKIFNYLDHSFKKNHPQKKMIALKKIYLLFLKMKLKFPLRLLLAQPLVLLHKIKRFFSLRFRRQNNFAIKFFFLFFVNYPNIADLYNPINESP